MKHLKTSNCKRFTFIFLMAVTATFAQKQSKKFTETFTINPDATVTVNTTHTDVVFETWDKNSVEVEGYIEVEGATKEEAEEVFANWNFKALGNSSEVKISTNAGVFWAYSGAVEAPMPNFDFNFEMPELPEIPEIEPIIIDMPDMSEMSFNFKDLNFDYEAYKKDGDAYLKEWKKEFDKNFDKDFKQNLEEWKNEMELHRKALDKHREELRKQRDIMREENFKLREEQRVEAQKMREEAKKARAAAMAKLAESSKAEGRPNVYYFKTGSENKNLKIKKTIKVKLPKSAKLKINVKHGEVKLASNLKNVKATLSHTRLLANVVDGDQTLIQASYSPLVVDTWNNGGLTLNFSEAVDLKNVKNLTLNAQSSEVVIGKLLNNATIVGSFGDLKIASVADTFKSLDVTLNNADASLTLPQSPFAISVNATRSRVTLPKDLVVVTTDVLKNGKLTRAYRKQKSSGKEVNIVTNLSTVVVQ